MTSTLIRMVASNSWFIVIGIMALEGICISALTELGVHTTRCKVAGVSTTLLTYNETYRLNSYFKRHDAVKIIYVIECIALTVLMYAESYRGAVQALRDIGPGIPWQIKFVMTLIAIAVCLAPVFTDMRVSKMSLFGFLTFMVSLEIVSDGDGYLGGAALILLVGVLSYYAFDLWFWLSQYVALSLIVVIDLLVVLAIQLVMGIVSIFKYIAAAHRRNQEAKIARERRRVRRDFMNAVHELDRECEFQIPQHENAYGQIVIDVYDIIAAMETEAHNVSPFGLEVPQPQLPCQVIELYPSSDQN